MIHMKMKMAETYYEKAERKQDERQIAIIMHETLGEELERMLQTRIFSNFPLFQLQRFSLKKKENEKGKNQ